MKIEVMDLVKACHGSMRKVIQLDDLIENLFFLQDNRARRIRQSGRRIFGRR